MEVRAGRLVQRFYHEVWNEADETVGREILHADLRFKASLGPVRTGPEGFIITCARFTPLWRTTGASSMT